MNDDILDLPEPGSKGTPARDRIADELGKRLDPDYDRHEARGYPEYADRPVDFIHDKLGDDSWGIQQKVARGVPDNDVIAVASCHGAGKTWISGRISLWYSMTVVPSITITTSRSERQVKGQLWKEIRMAHRGAIERLPGRLLQMELKMDDNWWMWGFTAPEKDPGRFQGFHEENVLVVVDEAAEVTEEIFEAIDGVLTSANAKLLMIGNPTNPHGRFAKAFEPSRPDFTVRISAFDTPNFTELGITEPDIASGRWEHKVERWREEHGQLPHPYLVTPSWVADKHDLWGPESAKYLAKVKAQFPKHRSDSLVPPSWFDDAVERYNRDPEKWERKAREHEWSYGLDVGDGQDPHALVARRGPVVRWIDERATEGDRKDNSRAVALARGPARETNGVVKVDQIGVGAGVLDQLIRDTEVRAAGVNFGSTSDVYDRTQFVNVRAEGYWHLRKRFQEGDIAIGISDRRTRERLREELSSMRYEQTARARIKIEPKDNIRKRLGRSPNLADGLVMAFRRTGYGDQIWRPE